MQKLLKESKVFIQDQIDVSNRGNSVLYKTFIEETRSLEAILGEQNKTISMMQSLLDTKEANTEEKIDEIMQSKLRG